MKKAARNEEIQVTETFNCFSPILRVASIDFSFLQHIILKIETIASIF